MAQSNHPDQALHSKICEEVVLRLFTSAYSSFDQKKGDINAFFCLCDRMVKDVYNRAMENTLQDVPFLSQSFVEAHFKPESEVEPASEYESMFKRDPTAPGKIPAMTAKKIGRYFSNLHDRLHATQTMAESGAWSGTYAQRASLQLQGQVLRRLTSGESDPYTKNKVRKGIYTTLAKNPAPLNLDILSGDDNLDYSVYILLLDAMQHLLECLHLTRDWEERELVLSRELMEISLEMLLPCKWIPRCSYDPDSQALEVQVCA